MNNYNRHIEMLTMVAEALGADLCSQTAFVGGTITGLIMTDDFSREQVRYTNDVDLIVHIMSMSSYHKLQEELRYRGFSENMTADAPMCAMWLQGIRVDLMPDDEGILGFSNRWYKDALKTAEDFKLTEELSIRVIRPDYFIATKLEAYLGRGYSSPIASSDIEDIVNVFDGRKELLVEIEQAPEELRKYIAEQLSVLLTNSEFEYVVQNCAMNNIRREQMLFERIQGASNV